MRLVPGRRIVILTPKGEREVQGPEQTPSTIDQLLAPILTADARQALAAAGVAEWGFEASRSGTGAGAGRTTAGRAFRRLRHRRGATTRDRAASAAIFRAQRPRPPRRRSKSCFA